jgi:hypothetical protein
MNPAIETAHTALQLALKLQKLPRLSGNSFQLAMNTFMTILDEAFGLGCGLCVSNQCVDREDISTQDIEYFVNEWLN